MNEDKYISSTEAAEALGVTVATVTHWIKKGYLEAHKIGPAKNSPYRILRSSVVEKLPETQSQ